MSCLTFSHGFSVLLLLLASFTFAAALKCFVCELDECVSGNGELEKASLTDEGEGKARRASFTSGKNKSFSLRMKQKKASHGRSVLLRKQGEIEYICVNYTVQDGVYRDWTVREDSDLMGCSLTSLSEDDKNKEAEVGEICYCENFDGCNAKIYDFSGIPNARSKEISEESSKSKCSNRNTKGYHLLKVFGMFIILFL